MDSGGSPRSNAFLAALGAPELEALEPRLQPVRLHAGWPVYEPHEKQDIIYFPTSGVISLHYAQSDGAVTELAQVGREGVVGLWALLGEHPTVMRAVVQIAGRAWSLPGSAARASFAGGGAFQAITLRYALAFMLQLAHTAVCSTRHSVAQRFCRWLLVCADRVDGDEIRMTHEVLAGVLGVRRQGVTEAAKKLEKRGIIAYHRGHIRILDRHALERAACECYAVVARESRALWSASLPGKTAPGALPVAYSSAP